MRFEFEPFTDCASPHPPNALVVIVASIAAFQAVDPASIPSQSFHKAWAEVDSELLLVTSGCARNFLDGSFDSRKGLALTVWESNPGLPRDRRNTVHYTNEELRM